MKLDAGATMNRQLDFALMLKVLYMRGHTLSDIAKKTGTSVNTLSTAKQETKAPPAGWLEGIAMLDYWLKATGEPPPRIGDYIELGEYYEDEISTAE
jgi:hypothetical protein